MNNTKKRCLPIYNMQLVCYYSFMGKFILAPSILSANFCRLFESMELIKNSHAQWVHIDIMDGSFVPDISFGQPIVRAIRPLSDLPFDVHLMTEHPENHIESFANAGADWITFHWEAAVHHHRIIEHIHRLGKKAGISIVPSTPVTALTEILPFVDLILVMSVNPGFGGQALIPNCLNKIHNLIELREKNAYNYLVSVDGGVNENTITSVAQTGVDVIVSGSAFFGGALNVENV